MSSSLVNQVNEVKRVKIVVIVVVGVVAVKTKMTGTATEVPAVRMRSIVTTIIVKIIARRAF